MTPATPPTHGPAPTAAAPVDVTPPAAPRRSGVAAALPGERGLAARIGAGVLLGIVAVAVTIPIAGSIARTVFLPSFAAIAVAAWYGGVWAGVVASLVCVVGVDYFVIPPVGGLRPTDPTDYLSLAGFAAVSWLIGGVADRLHAARATALRAARELEEANARLQEQAMELEITNHQLQENAVELEAQTTELEAASEELVEARASAEGDRERLARVIAQLPNAVGVLHGPDHVFIAVSDAYARMSGNRPLVGRANAEVFPELVAQGFVDLLDRVFETGEPLHGTDVPVRWEADGDGALEDRFIDFTYKALRGPDGRVEGIVFEVTDVTARHTAQAERERLLEAERAAREDAEQARERAEEANAAKSQFLATMSHELRTPLNAIQGHAQLMEMGLHGPVTEAQREALKRVDRAQRHLLGLINDILSYARLESGRVEFHVERVALGDVARDVATLVAPQFHARGIAFEVRAANGGATVHARADRERLAQILLNLLSNALKFTSSDGRVTLEVARDDGKAIVRVRDSGMGIPPDKLEAIFEPFVQLRDGFTATLGGTGLGLAISRDLARGMGGELAAESVRGEGSTFTLVLPGG